MARPSWSISLDGTCVARAHTFETTIGEIVTKVEISKRTTHKLNGKPVPMPRVMDQFTESISKLKGYPYRVITSTTDKDLKMLENKK